MFLVLEIDWKKKYKLYKLNNINQDSKDKE